MKCLTKSLSSTCSTNYQSPFFEIDGNDMYKDGAFYGKILTRNSNETQLTVKIKSENRFLNGMILTFHLTEP